MIGCSSVPPSHLSSLKSSPPTVCLCTETGPIDPVLIEQYNTPGFVGCLSRVQFNGVAPLKSALRKAAQALSTSTGGQADRQPVAASPVSYQGKLVESNCGASPLTIPPMSAATDPGHLDNTGGGLSLAVINLVLYNLLNLFGVLSALRCKDPLQRGESHSWWSQQRLGYHRRYEEPHQGSWCGNKSRLWHHVQYLWCPEVYSNKV